MQCVCVEGVGGGSARDIKRLDDLHGRNRDHAKDAGSTETERVQNGEPADEGAQARRIGAAHVAAKTFRRERCVMSVTDTRCDEKRE
jgi:hypothetical protein